MQSKFVQNTKDDKKLDVDDEIFERAGEGVAPCVSIEGTTVECSSLEGLDWVWAAWFSSTAMASPK